MYEKEWNIDVEQYANDSSTKDLCGDDLNHCKSCSEDNDLVQNKVCLDDMFVDACDSIGQIA